MKKTYIVLGSLALSSIAYSQSLFQEDPNESASQSSPLTYTARLGVGYNDSFTDSTTATPTSSAYVNATLGANYVKVSPTTSWRIGASVTANKYLDSPSGSSDIYYNSRLNFSLNHRFNEKTRYVTSSYVSWGIEPDYSFAFTQARAPSEHLYMNTDHAIGHRWTSRFATYTGVRYSRVDYHGSQADKAGNRINYGIYHDNRYSVGPNTTLTAGLSYNRTEASGSASDSTDLTGTIGVEHRLNGKSFVVAQIGATRREVDTGKSGYYSPYGSLTFNTALNRKTSLRAFARYGIENYGTSQGNNAFNTNRSFRIGTEIAYTVSDKLSLRAGVNYIRSSYDDGRDVTTNTAIASQDQDLINPYVGFTYKINARASLDASYNYSKSSSSVAGTAANYERNRLQIGVSTTF